MSLITKKIEKEAADEISKIFENAPKKPPKPRKEKQKVEKPAKPKKKFKIQDGLKIYTEESLKIGRGGTTKDCPFDCKCCF